jgi:hypothetical protein
VKASVAPPASVRISSGSPSTIGGPMCQSRTGSGLSDIAVSGSGSESDALE